MHLGAGLFTVLVVSTASVSAPGDLLAAADGPDSFELVEAETGLTFDDYAELEPDAVLHVEAASIDTDDMTAAVDIWTSPNDDILLRQVTLWGDENAAEAFVEQAATIAAADGMDRRESLYTGGAQYAVSDPSGVASHLLAWSQGNIGVSLELFSLEERDVDVVHQAAEALSIEIRQSTGLDAVEATTDEGVDDAASSSGGGISILTVFIWLLVIGGAIWLFVKIRRRVRAAKRQSTSDGGGDTRGGDNDDDDELDVDDIIERARARGRAEREVDAIPDPTEEWTPPDDY